MEDARIHLIGVDYRDRTGGPRKLERIYDRIQPDIIVHPFSEEDHHEMAAFLEDIGKRLGDIGDGGSGALELLMHYTVPFTVAVGNAYAVKHKVEAGYAFIPDFNRARFNTAKSFAAELYASSLGKEEADGKVVWKINNFMKKLGEPDPNGLWETVLGNESGLPGVLTYLVHWFIDPAYHRRTGQLAEIVTQLAGEKRRVAVAIEMEHLADSVGTLYRRLKKVGAKREPSR